ncbi:hypothetical protein EZV62_008325 [Acer yangbiense]|uniref:Jacalin-type lectin domain-containing protein n=1 Tax=Acer yangbiense TaxID=1000413 RepID=A0A5C7ICI5_9ROSI|nr:hypothetical protein EZV62_008325 [Acer yangbiense]
MQGTILIGPGGVPKRNSLKFEPAPGLKDATITFGPTEYLTKISGTTTKINEVVVIESLPFYTNTNKLGYGPYGPTTGTAFEVPLENGEVVGFFGSAGDFINSIGIYVIPHAP